MKNGIAFALGLFTVASSLGGAMANYLVGLLGQIFGMYAGIIFILVLIAFEMVVALMIMRLRVKTND